MGRCEKCGRDIETEKFFGMELCDLCFHIEAKRADGIWPDEKDLKEQSLIRLRNVPSCRKNFAVGVISSRWEEMFNLLQNFEDDQRVVDFMSGLDKETGYSIKGLLKGELVEV